MLLSIDSNIFSQSLNEYNLAGLALATVKGSSQILQC